MSIVFEQCFHDFSFELPGAFANSLDSMHVCCGLFSMVL